MKITCRPRWSLGRGKTLVPSSWQATAVATQLLGGPSRQRLTAKARISRAFNRGVPLRDMRTCPMRHRRLGPPPSMTWRRSPTAMPPTAWPAT